MLILSLTLNFRIKVVSFESLTKYKKRIQIDPSFRGAYPKTLLGTLYENQMTLKSKRLKFCKESFTSIPTIIYTKKDFYLLDAMNELIEMLKAAGLIDYWHFQSIDRQLLSYVPPRKPKILNVDGLMGGFQVLGFGCAISFVVFVSEIVASKIRKISKQTKVVAISNVQIEKFEAK